jgi:hypothetical protein
MSTTQDQTQTRSLTCWDVTFHVVLLAAVIFGLVGTIRADSTVGAVLAYLGGAIAASTLGLLLGFAVADRHPRS